MEQAQKIRQSINDPGWDGLDAVADEAGSEPNQLDREFLNTFSSEDGKKVLAYLENITVRQPAWMPGSDPSIGYSREGQNSIVREIQARMRRALNV
jgi:hypothetical protein